MHVTERVPLQERVLAFAVLAMLVRTVLHVQPITGDQTASRALLAVGMVLVMAVDQPVVVVAASVQHHRPPRLMVLPVINALRVTTVLPVKSARLLADPMVNVMMVSQMMVHVYVIWVGLVVVALLVMQRWHGHPVEVAYLGQDSILASLVSLQALLVVLMVRSIQPMVIASAPVVIPVLIVVKEYVTPMNGVHLVLHAHAMVTASVMVAEQERGQEDADVLEITPVLLVMHVREVGLVVHAVHHVITIIM